jgi:hypothetical protein
MQFATIKGLRIEKYTLQSQNWRESAKTNKTCDLLPPAATSACVAENRAGAANATFELHVVVPMPPKPPQVSSRDIFEGATQKAAAVAKAVDVGEGGELRRVENAFAWGEKKREKSSGQPLPAPLTPSQVLLSLAWLALGESRKHLPPRRPRPRPAALQRTRRLRRPRRRPRPSATPKLARSHSPSLFFLRMEATSPLWRMGEKEGKKPEDDGERLVPTRSPRYFRRDSPSSPLILFSFPSPMTSRSTEDDEDDVDAESQAIFLSLSLLGAGKRNLIVFYLSSFFG